MALALMAGVKSRVDGSGYRRWRDDRRTITYKRIVRFPEILRVAGNETQPAAAIPEVPTPVAETTAGGAAEGAGGLGQGDPSDDGGSGSGTGFPGGGGSGDVPKNP